MIVNSQAIAVAFTWSCGFVSSCLFPQALGPLLSETVFLLSGGCHGLIEAIVDGKSVGGCFYPSP
jgi:hypothetical protein